MRGQEPPPPGWSPCPTSTARSVAKKNAGVRWGQSSRARRIPVGPSGSVSESTTAVCTASFAAANIAATDGGSGRAPSDCADASRAGANDVVRTARSPARYRRSAQESLPLAPRAIPPRRPVCNDGTGHRQLRAECTRPRTVQAPCTAHLQYRQKAVCDADPVPVVQAPRSSHQ